MGRSANSLVAALLAVAAAVAWPGGTPCWGKPVDGGKEADLPGPLPCAVCFVPEMAPLPDGYTWQAAEGKAAKAPLPAGFAEAWAKVRPGVRAHCTPAMVTALSRWARKQMQAYKALAAWDGLEFAVRSTEKNKGVALLEATAETLPSHNRLVTRWLKLLVYYDVSAKRILQVTITIRGEILE